MLNQMPPKQPLDPSPAAKNEGAMTARLTIRLGSWIFHERSPFVQYGLAVLTVTLAALATRYMLFGVQN
jgi:hypothetical protein